MTSEAQVRGAELVGALCLATDLGMGFPFEHGLHTTLIAMRLADRLGLDRATSGETYYACLLAHAGCTTDAHVAPQVFGGSLTREAHPFLYGSRREVVKGLLRALPDPDAPASPGRARPRPRAGTPPTTSGSTARAITARRPVRTLAFPPGCWRPPTPTTR